MGKKVVLRNRRFSIIENAVKLPNGNDMTVFYMDPGPAIFIIPVLSGKILLERQYRPVLGKWIYELPAGRVDMGESASRAVRRELEEETGYYPNTVKRLFATYSSPGLLTEAVPIYLATGLMKRKKHLGKHEVIKAKFYPIGELLRMIRSNRINDGKTIQAILFYNQFLKHKSRV